MRTANRKKMVTFILLAALLLAGCGKEKADTAATATSEEAAESQASEDTAASGISLEDIPPYAGSPYVTLNENRPLFTEEEITTEAFEEYYPLDERGRATGAFACLSRELMPTEERGMIGTIQPSGWHTVKYDGIEGAYLYNRCHLIAYQLTGENDNENNLITGTRYLNVEGMQPFESRAAWYVRFVGYHVMYRVTPLYEGNNLLASGVLMESYCVEKPESSATFCVFCYNVQPDVEIDYATGYSTGPAFTGSTRSMPQSTGGLAGTTESKEAEAPTEAEEVDSTEETGEPSPIPQEITFIGNRNSEVLHYPWCTAVEAMSEKNKVYFSEPLEEIPDNYHPCGMCMKEWKKEP